MVFFFWLQERVPEEERKHQEALADVHVAVDEESMSENSSIDEGKEDNRLLLKRLKALEVRDPIIHREKNLLCWYCPAGLTVSPSLPFLVLPD